MNPYKAAIKIVRSLLSDQIENEDVVPIRAMYQVVDHELEGLYDWISAEDNGLSDAQIMNAHDFPWEGGAPGMPSCAACGLNAEVHILATRYDTKETKEILVCKAHMLDPGPLLDW